MFFYVLFFLEFDFLLGCFVAEFITPCVYSCFLFNILVDSILQI